MAELRPHLPNRQRSGPSPVIQVAQAYGHITPPEEGDVEGVYGRCLVTVKEQLDGVHERLNTVEHNAAQLLTTHSPGNSQGATSHSSRFDAIDETLQEISDQLNQLERRMINTEDRVVNTEDTVAELQDGSIDRAGSVNADIEDLELRLGARLNAVEKWQEDEEHNTKETLRAFKQEVDGYFRRWGKRSEEAVEALKIELRKEVRDGIDRLGQVLDAKSRNHFVKRLHHLVWPVGVRYTDAKGEEAIRCPQGPPRKLGYYWRLHERKFRK